MNKERSSSKILLGVAGLLALIQVLFSDFIGTPFGGYADQRIVLSVIPVFLIFGFIFSCARYGAVSLSTVAKVLFPTLLLCLSYLVSALPFQSQPYVWVEPVMYTFFFLAMVASGASLSWAVASISYSKILVLIIASTCLLYGLASINVYLFAIIDGVTKLTDFIPWGFVNIRYWSHIATWCLPLMPLAVLVGPLKNIRSWRIAVLLGAGMWWWILFLTTGRGSALGIIFGVTFAGLLFGRRALPWLKVFSIYLATGFVIWLVLSVVIPSFMADGVQVRTIKADSSGRMSLFAEAWQMSLKNFPFGMGPQSWLTHTPITEAYANGQKFGHPHNMYLMWAAEYGWLLIAAMALVVVQAIRNFWRRRAELFETEDPEQLLLLAGFTASVSAALFHAGMSAVFMAPGSMLVGMFVLIGFWAMIEPAPVMATGRRRSKPNPKARIVIGALVAAAIALVWALWANEVWQYYKDMRADEPYYFEHESEGTLPRFWFHGNFPRDVQQ
jgi:O-antigen ligase